MSTRTIVTSQPDVACDVCERRLLRGEQPDVFIAAGRRRIVCELCAPRAAQEGWLRESDGEAMALPPLRPRRGRTLIERILLLARPAHEEPAERRRATGRGVYDFLEAERPAARPAGPPDEDLAGPPWAAPDDAAPAPAAVTGGAPADPDGYLERAVEVFNQSEFPRRHAGLARSLGPPEISVRSAEHLASVVRIVVAWELCWYRYEVDLSEPPYETRLLDQGTELSQLSREERVVGARADESGLISL